MNAATALTSDQADGLEAHVDAVSLSLQTLLLLLAREREALRSRADAETLERIARDKHTAVEQVSELYTLLRETLEDDFGPRADLAESISALRRSHPDLALRVDRLVSLTRECQQANQDNGVLVSAGLRSAHRALDTLHAVDGPRDQDGTYGPGGQAPSGPAGARLTVRA